MDITPLERLQNLEDAAAERSSEYVRLPDGGSLQVVAFCDYNQRNWRAAARFDYWLFPGHPNDSGGEKIDRTIATGLMAWKWGTPLEV